MTDILNLLPEMLSGEKLKTALAELPKYNENICMQNETERLIALSDIYDIYIPSPMTEEIYGKLYIALLRSMQKKFTKNAVMQRNQNHKALLNRDYSGIIGGSDSFTIIGNSGIGKSRAISRSLSLINTQGIIEMQKPYVKIIPCVVVQCPFDSSVKGLLLEILRKVDEVIGTDYYKNALKIRMTTDILIGSVSQVAINHIGLLIVDEIQNVVNSKHGKSLIGMLTQLINNSGISICMVGTPESSLFFEREMYLARRSIGLKYTSMECDECFYDFCRTLFEYQYTKNRTKLSERTLNWLYEHSGGVASVVVSLVHDAQEIAILSGKEIISIETLSEAYTKRLEMLHDYIEPTVIRKKQTVTKKKPKTEQTLVKTDIEDNFCIAQTVARAKTNNEDVVNTLKKYISVEEIKP